MKDLLNFDKMITPNIITIVYWFMLLMTIVLGLGAMFGAPGGFSFINLIWGIFVIIAGCIGARICCELLIVLFKMNDALQEIRNK